jgi:hypothetical protein
MNTDLIFAVEKVICNKLMQPLLIVAPPSFKIQTIPDEISDVVELELIINKHTYIFTLFNKTTKRFCIRIHHNALLTSDINVRIDKILKIQQIQKTILSRFGFTYSSAVDIWTCSKTMTELAELLSDDLDFAVELF